MQKHPLVYTLVFFSTMLCFAHKAHSGESPLQYFAKAKMADPRYKAAQHEFEAVGFAEPQAMAALLPTISAEVSHTDVHQRISSANTVYSTGSSNYPAYGEMLTLSLPLFRLSSWIGYNQAKLKVKQAGVNLIAAEQDLIMRLATAYLAALAAQDALTFAIAERDAIKRNLDLVQEKYRGGLTAIVGLHEARARHANKNADVIAAESELDDRLQAMREIVGTVPDALMRLDESIPLEVPEPADMSNWVAVARDKNLMTEVRRMSIEIAREDVRKIKSGHLPSIDLLASYNRKDSDGSQFGGGSDVANTDIMARLTIPIYSGGVISAQAGEALQRQYMVQEDLERDIRQAERQARSAYQGVMSGIVRIEALRQSLISTESASELRRAGYKAGIETMLAVLDAERDLYATKRDAARARYDYLLNRLRLKQAVGSLGEEDLVMFSRLLK